MSSGIYEIICLPDGRTYVGASNDVSKRKNSHFWALRGNRHRNLNLQAAWNTYGEASFVFTVLEHVDDKTSLGRREQEWIRSRDATNPAIGFNLPTVNGRPGLPVSPERRKKISDRNRMKWADPDFKARVSAAISAARIGKPRAPHSLETREKMAAAFRARAHLQVQVPLSEETRAKMSKVRTGKKHSAETLRKMRETYANRRKSLI